MSSRLVYFGNIISRADALVKANVIKEPVWLEACKRFPPLSAPVNPELPEWNTVEQTKIHRVGPFIRLDGHRFDPKKPTEYPKDKQLNHPDQPHHIYFSKDEKRKQFFSERPEEPVHLTYRTSSVSRCEQWAKGEEVLEVLEVDVVKDTEYLYEEFADIRNNCDVSDILEKAGIKNI